MPSVRGVAAVVLGTVSGWAVLLVEFGAWCYLGALRNPNFGPEIGPLGTYLVFSALLSVFFVPGFLLVACPAILLSRRRLPAGAPWLRALVGALCLAATAPIMILLSGGWHSDAEDGVFMALLFLGPGVVGGRIVQAVQASGGSMTKPAEVA